MNAHRGYYQQKVCLFGTLMAYCEHFLGERIRGETKMLTFIHWSSGIKLPTVCWFYLKLSVLKCAREFPQATEFENFLICLVLLITRNFHFYFAFKYSLLLFWGIIMAARSMFSCCRFEATSLVKRPPRSKKCAGSRNHLLSSNNTFRALYSRKKAFVKSPSNNDITPRNHFLSSNNTFWALYSHKKEFFQKSVEQWYHAQKSFFELK